MIGLTGLMSPIATNGLVVNDQGNDHPCITFPDAGQSGVQIFTGEYSDWVRQEMPRRRSQYAAKTELNLLSFVTSAYDTPIEFLSALVDSVCAQDFGEGDTFEWVILDNGSKDPAIVAFLRSLSALGFVRHFRVEDNLGIIGGMDYAVKRARGRYVLPLDSDDYLYPDCARIMASHIQEHGYPAVLYSDEDKLDGFELLEPYFKPAWDPVLLVNSCYIAHLCAIDRGLATLLGAYSDPQAMGCHDWDTFIRFMNSGYKPVHVPESLYSWRRHSQSCASNIDSKNYIHTSHRHTLEGFLLRQRRPELYYLDYNPLFNRTPDWWMRRRHIDAKPLLTIVLKDQDAASTDGDRFGAGDYAPHRISSISQDATAGDLYELLRSELHGSELVRLVSSDVSMSHSEWPWEALTTLELFPDTAMVGGPIYNELGQAVSAGIYFGYGSGLDTPDLLRPKQDPGYFAQMWKQHSVDAMSSRNCVIHAPFLLDALASSNIPPETPLRMLGEWLGATAARWGKRIVYSPFLAAEGSGIWSHSSSDESAFRLAHGASIPEARYYSRHLDRTGERPYQLRRQEIARSVLEQAAATTATLEVHLQP